MTKAVSPPALKSRSFLKWAGGKYRLTEQISQLLPKRKSCLIEPFVGAGSVFLNSNFKQYILADVNPDLINLFNIVKQDVEQYITDCKPIFFHPEANTASYYYLKRDKFNQTQDIYQRAILFLYLNRFGFNGLCRYNSQNKFNVPFGAYKTHYFPERELRFFAQKAQSAVFICKDFRETFQLADKDSVIYCDPPYAPLEQASNFTHYSEKEFTLHHQRELADLAKKTVIQHNIPVIISNHDTAFTREIYQGAKIKKIKVQRSISHTAQKRIKVNELIAVFKSPVNLSSQK